MRWCCSVWTWLKHLHTARPRGSPGPARNAAHCACCPALQQSLLPPCVAHEICSCCRACCLLVLQSKHGAAASVVPSQAVGMLSWRMHAHACLLALLCQPRCMLHHLACSRGTTLFSFWASSQLLRSAKWVKKNRTVVLDASACMRDLLMLHVWSGVGSRLPGNTDITCHSDRIGSDSPVLARCTVWSLRSL